MSKKMLFVWNFHGVLEQDNIYAVEELVNLVLRSFGIKKKISIRQVIDWYGLSWFDYFRLIYPEGNSEIWQKMVRKVFSLQQQGWEIVKRHIKARDFSEEVLTEINNQGHCNIILSNTHPSHIKTFTDILNITQFFDDIIGVDSHHSSRIDKQIHNIKTQTLASFLQNKDFGKVIMIGDKESDILAGKICGATTYLFIDNKLNPTLQQTESHFTTYDLRDILRELNG